MCTEYLSSVVNRYPAILRNFVCRGEKWQNKDRLRLLCFVINVLNNKTIILLNLAKYTLILRQPGLRPRPLNIRRYSALFRRLIVKYLLFYAVRARRHRLVIHSSRWRPWMGHGSAFFDASPLFPL